MSRFRLLVILLFFSFFLSASNEAPEWVCISAPNSYSENTMPDFCDATTSHIVGMGTGSEPLLDFQEDYYFAFVFTTPDMVRVAYSVYEAEGYDVQFTICTSEVDCVNYYSAFSGVVYYESLLEQQQAFYVLVTCFTPAGCPSYSGFTIDIDPVPADIPVDLTFWEQFSLIGFLTSWPFFLLGSWQVLFVWFTILYSSLQAETLDPSSNFHWYYFYFPFILFFFFSILKNQLFGRSK